MVNPWDYFLMADSRLALSAAPVPGNQACLDASFGYQRSRAAPSRLMALALPRYGFVHLSSTRSVALYPFSPKPSYPSQLYIPEGRSDLYRPSLQMPLHHLRSSMALIPQVPVLFTGSIRLNLSPFGLRNDAELWNALRR